MTNDQMMARLVNAACFCVFGKTHAKVNYSARGAVDRAAPSDCEWMVPGTFQECK